jgi:hypothetical protein
MTVFTHEKGRSFNGLQNLKARASRWCPNHAMPAAEQFIWPDSGVVNRLPSRTGRMRVTATRACGWRRSRPSGRTGRRWPRARLSR